MKDADSDAHGQTMRSAIALAGGIKRSLRDSPLRRPLLRALSLVRRLAHAPAGIYTLCYHHIPAVHQRSFARQLDYLGRHGAFISVDQAVALLHAGKAISGRHFVVSVDDGYADLVDVALPVLAECGIPAIAFIVASWLDNPPGTATGRADSYVSRADLETWCRAGMLVGSHSYTHTHLIGLPERELSDELRHSSATLAQVTGRMPRHFACPWGVPGRDFRPELTARLAESAGYVSLFTTLRGHATGAADLWLMPRHVAEPEWSLSELDALIGAYPFVGPSTDQGRSRSTGQ